MDITDILVTVFSAMTPLGEVRLAIPLAMHTYDMVWYQALGWGFLGNMVPVVLLLWGLDRAARVLLTFPNPAGRLLRWRASRLQKGYSRLFQRWGALALVLFVAVPLPLTGAWTGCLAAWVFAIRPKVALPAITAGVLMAAGIVTALTQLSLDFPFLGD